MATYKQRVPIHRAPSGRHSPEYAIGSAAHSVAAPGGVSSLLQHSHSHGAEQYYSAHQSFSSAAYHNPDDDILDNASDQEWTSVRRTTRDVQSRRAAYHQRMLEQRIQDWHLVLDQHRLNSSYQSDNSSSTEANNDNDDITATLPPTASRASASSSSSPPSPRLPPIDTQISFAAVVSAAPSVITSPGAATQTSGSHFAFSDLASDSVGDESEDLELWSPDDDAHSASTSRRHQHNPYRRSSLLRPSGSGVVPSSPTASQSSVTSFNNLAHPSFYHYQHGDNNPLRLHNRMPFHDGSGNFISHHATPHQSRSHTGSELDSDQGGWESTVSQSSKAPSRRVKQQYRSGIAVTRSLDPFSPGEFESMFQSIASLQVEQQQLLLDQPTDQQQSQQQQPLSPSSSRRPYAFRPLARDGLTLRPRWPRSSASPPSVASSVGNKTKSRHVRLLPPPHAPTPRRPSSLQKAFKSYESDNEDLSRLVATIPSNTGWFQMFEQTIHSFNTKHGTDLNLSEPFSCSSSTLHPIKALAQHSAAEEAQQPCDLSGLAKTLVPEEATQLYFQQRRQQEQRVEAHNDGLRSMNATPTLESTRRSTVAAVSTRLPENHIIPAPAATSSTPPPQRPLSAQEQATLRTVQKHISASSLETLQRLQDRQRSADYHQHSSFQQHRRRNSHGSVISDRDRDPMQQIHFAPTLAAREPTDDEEGSSISSRRRHHHKKSSSLDGGQLWKDDYEDSSEHDDTTLFRAFISTLRRFRDHVKSNLLYPELDEQYLSSLQFENSDLGIEWATGGGTPPPSLLNHLPFSVGAAVTATTDSNSSNGSSNMSTATTQKRPGFCRARSDCALESLKLQRRRRAADSHGSGSSNSGRSHHMRQSRIAHNDHIGYIEVPSAPMFV